MSFGSMHDDEHSAPMAEINVTPLVDVMLVLLIVFMVTMPVLTHSIPLNLPTAAKQAEQDLAHAKNKQPPFRVTIQADGQYFIGAQVISAEELARVLSAEHAKNPDLVLAIAADQASEHGALTQLLEAAQSAGVSKVGFVTETPSVLKAQ